MHAPSRFDTASPFGPPARRIVRMRGPAAPSDTEGLFSGLPIVGGLLDGIFGGGSSSTPAPQGQQNGGGGLLGGLGPLLGALAPIAGTALGGPLGGALGGLLGPLLGGGQPGAAGGAGGMNPAALMQLLQGGMGLASSMNPAQLGQLLSMMGPVASMGGQLLGGGNLAQTLAPALADNARATVAATTSAVSPALDALLNAQRDNAARDQATAEHRTIVQNDTRHAEVMQGLRAVQQTVGARTVSPQRF